jgi:hypothetical protein
VVEREAFSVIIALNCDTAEGTPSSIFKRRERSGEKDSIGLSWARPIGEEKRRKRERKMISSLGIKYGNRRHDETSYDQCRQSHRTLVSYIVE